RSTCMIGWLNGLGCLPPACLLQCMRWRLPAPAVRGIVPITANMRPGPRPRRRPSSPQARRRGFTRLPLLTRWPLIHQERIPMHDWDVTPDQAVAIQQRLRSLVHRENALPLDRLRTIAGIDAAYKEGARAAVVLLSFPALE